ncbi:hypothetical protein Peur_041558 [Populus x canadensis]
MTTGRINQVAFLGDTTTRTTPDADETRGRDGRGSRSYRARAARNGRSQGRRPRRRHRILHPKARAIARGPVRRESARLEHGRRCWARPAPPGRRAAERDSFTFEFHRSGYAAQEPRLAARHPGGLGPRVMGAAGRQFGAPARSLPTRTARLPLMRLCVHATTIPTSEPRPREQVETPERDRARTAGREGDLKGTSNKPDAKDLEGTRDRPRGETTGTIMRGAVCPGSEDGGQASAAGTSRHELGDCKESQRMGARTAI